MIDISGFLDPRQRQAVRIKAQGLAAKVLPDSAKAQAHRTVAKPGSGERDGTG
ncbi:hypothetical protein ACQPZG_05275 (plasmid) [Streptomyces sp. CA-294286]|uniref:hypothetical protein n=1 Tax=Streptomyces sp. CA-294286 TaxID=3240070 RepID=UPI003D8BB729